jgi:hypothetical protein
LPFLQLLILPFCTAGKLVFRLLLTWIGNGTRLSGVALSPYKKVPGLLDPTKKEEEEAVDQ